jgi:hypothetical protein
MFTVKQSLEACGQQEGKEDPDPHPTGLEEGAEKIGRERSKERKMEVLPTPDHPAQNRAESPGTSPRKNRWNTGPPDEPSHRPLDPEKHRKKVQPATSIKMNKTDQTEQPLDPLARIFMEKQGRKDSMRIHRKGGAHPPLALQDSDLL